MGAVHAFTKDPEDIIVNTEAADCGKCHYRNEDHTIAASGGFIKHHEQYEELFQSKHAVIDCVQCHDPHTGVIQLRQAGEQTTRTQCENCHLDQAKHGGNEEVHNRIKVDCIECHMPKVTKSAVGDPERFTGDLRTHLMAIDPDLVEQFVENDDGALISEPALSLNFACRHCHNPDGLGPEVTDEELQDAARGYHIPPVVEEEVVEEEPQAEEAAADSG